MQRPTSVVVFGVLNLIFGALGIVGTLFSSAILFMPERPGIKNPVLELVKQNAGYAAFLKVSLVLGLLAAAVVLLAGIGLLASKAWGRTLSIVYAIYGIVASVVGVIANYFFLVAPLMQRATKMPAGPEQAGAIGGAIGSLFGGCFGLIFPVLLLIFMCRAPVVAFFRQQEVQSPFEPPSFRP